MTVTVRPFEQGDWPAMCRIHDAARLTELTGSVSLDAFLPLEETYEQEDLFGNPVTVAEVDGAVAGFLAASPTEITWLYVDPALTRQGIARALVRTVLDAAPGDVELEVLDGNSAAQAFYEALGFTRSSTTSGRLPGNESFTVTVHTMVWRRGAR